MNKRLTVTLWVLSINLAVLNVGCGSGSFSAGNSAKVIATTTAGGPANDTKGTTNVPIDTNPWTNVNSSSNPTVGYINKNAGSDSSSTTTVNYNNQNNSNSQTVSNGGGTSTTGITVVNKWQPNTVITDIVTLTECKAYLFQITGDLSLCVKCFLQYEAQGGQITAAQCGCIATGPAHW